MQRCTQLSLITEQGFTVFSHILSDETCSPNHPAITKPIKFLLKSLSFIAMGNKTWGHHHFGNDNDSQDSSSSSSSSSISSSGSSSSIFKWWHWLTHRVLGGGLGWINGREPLQFGALMGTLNSPKTYCRLSRLSPLAHVNRADDGDDGAKTIKNTSKNKKVDFFKPLVSNKPKLHDDDVEKLCALTFEVRNIGQRLKTWRRLNKTLNDNFINDGKNDKQPQQQQQQHSKEGNIVDNSILNSILLVLCDLFCDLVFSLLYFLKLAFKPPSGPHQVGTNLKKEKTEEYEEYEVVSSSKPGSILNNDSSQSTLRKRKVGGANDNMSKQEEIREPRDNLTTAATTTSSGTAPCGGKKPVATATARGRRNDTVDEAAWQAAKEHVLTHTGTLWHSMGGCGCGSVLDGPNLTVR
jgi:hypothetical protein